MKIDAGEADPFLSTFEACRSGRVQVHTSSQVQTQLGQHKASQKEVATLLNKYTALWALRVTLATFEATL